MPLIFTKHLGETPLQALDRLRIEQPNYAKATLSYAGRLDPMAEGLLLVLVDEECKHSQDYFGFDKDYEATILFGVETDTHDVLGRIISHVPTIPDFAKVTEAIDSIIGKQQQMFPAYSSKPVDGKPLFQWAREDKLGEIEMPSKEIEVYSANIMDTKIIDASELLKQITEKISHVNGDFRQAETIEGWQKLLVNPADQYLMVKVHIACSSGTYIRSLAQGLGKTLCTGACLLGLKRTKVGQYSL